MSRNSYAAVMGRVLKAALVLSAFAATPRYASAQLSVSHPDVFLKSNLTSHRSTVLRITNQASEDTEAVIQIQDWHRDESGASATLPLGTGAGSCREHLKITPSSLRISAHETEHVRVSFDGAYDKSCWALVVVQPSEQPAAQNSVTPSSASGVKVYVQPEWARREGEVVGLELLSSDDGRNADGIEVLFRNSGDAHLDTFGAVEIRNGNNLVVATVEIARFPVAPTDLRRIRLTLPALPQGRYTAVALFDYAGRDIAEREMSFEVR